MLRHYPAIACPQTSQYNTPNNHLPAFANPLPKIQVDKDYGSQKSAQTETDNTKWIYSKASQAWDLPSGHISANTLNAYRIHQTTSTAFICKSIRLPRAPSFRWRLLFDGTTGRRQIRLPRLPQRKQAPLHKGARAVNWNRNHTSTQATWLLRSDHESTDVWVVTQHTRKPERLAWIHTSFTCSKPTIAYQPTPQARHILPSSKESHEFTFQSNTLVWCTSSRKVREAYIFHCQLEAIRPCQPGL